MESSDNRIRGAVLGLLAGDALGVPYEFHGPGDIPPLAQIEMTPPAGFRRAHGGVPPGTWSDDGAQALCLLASLLECGKLDAEDFGQRLLAWRDDGSMAVGGHVFDIGITTSTALAAIGRGVPAQQAGPSGQGDNGNGSLMRVLPLALWHKGTDGELAQDAQAQSRVTHGHMRAQVCCALYCLWARRILQNAADPWAEATATLRAIYQKSSDAAKELEDHVRPDALAPGTGSGYVVDSLRSARWVMQGENYEQVVRHAIALGNDTDTTACIAGGIAGLTWGENSIPTRWQDALRGMEMAEPLLGALCQRSGQPS